jgi:hypothetical protein
LKARAASALRVCTVAHPRLSGRLRQHGDSHHGTGGNSKADDFFIEQGPLFFTIGFHCPR